MADLTSTQQQEAIPLCRWQVRIHDSGRDICSPEFDTYREMREWEDAWHRRNPTPL